jgi:hypothetical protein
MVIFAFVAGGVWCDYITAVTAIHIHQHWLGVYQTILEIYWSLEHILDSLKQKSALLSADKDTMVSLEA